MRDLTPEIIKSLEDLMRDLTPEIIKSLSNDQIELLAELGELAKTEKDLTEKIENTRKQSENVGLLRSNRTTKALFEDTNFDELLSIKSIREREAIREKIAGLMQALIEAGLGDLAFVRRQALNYGVELKKKE
jgi:glutamate mutase epsilon subunit